MGAEPVRRPGEAPPGGGVFEERVGVGGRNARDRCTGTGDGWYKKVCASVRPGSQLLNGFEKQNEREENILLAS